MSHTVTIDNLSSFGIERSTQSTVGFRMDEMLDPQRCRDFLTEYMERIEAPNIKVAASLFIKYYARVSVGSLLYSLGNYHCALAMPLKGCVFNGDRKKLCVHENECVWRMCHSENREAWRQTVLQQFFTEHFTPLIQALTKVRISSRILWENTAIRIHSVYRKLLQLPLTVEEKILIQSDFTFLKEADGSLFGLAHNPMSPYLREEAIYGTSCMRKTCCLFHRIENKKEDLERCVICPLER
ncbi:IucA/IucC family C-terminal-domain containing protein [Geomicrobium sp. JCM 19039]|uniref:IucA/IucC family C-terminal-domain containing protein n=1 Tax=Geomicrobium sp. JCM 19039 TaxID=1460636 RepID=UPI00045F4A81|nr:IucA/IucC family C-terminal-domain containing protein [Geomicrobium sp. JCM 19039]GAK14085.1 hypothetical protein JCM19039_3981 [Geomicrobium sp. JCM 19039]